MRFRVWGCDYWEGAAQGGFDFCVEVVAAWMHGWYQLSDPGHSGLSARFLGGLLSFFAGEGEGGGGGEETE